MREVIVSLCCLAFCASGTLNAEGKIMKLGEEQTVSPMLKPCSLVSTIRQDVQIQFLLYLPQGYEEQPNQKWPLVLFLHGAGERGDDLKLVARHGPPKLVASGKHFPFILVAPQCPAGRFWNPAELIVLLDQVQAEYRIDPTRVYVTGLSMGGFATWSLVTMYPERFAAAVPICGGGVAAPVYLAGGKWAQELRRIPIWAFHGAKDPLVPVAESERMIEAFRSIGNQNVRLTVYPEAEHDSWTVTYDNEEVYRWLLQQKRPQ